MLIDTPTAVSEILAVIIAMFTAMLSVHLSAKPVDKLRYCVVILVVSICVISFIVVLHRWNVTVQWAESVLQMGAASIKGGVSRAKIAITDFTRRKGAVLLLSAGLVPWIFLFLRVFFANRKHHVLTLWGHLWCGILFPVLICTIAVKATGSVFNFLYSADRTNHILWISVVSLIFNTALAAFFCMKFMEVWRN